jgi:hypothetical protein
VFPVRDERKAARRAHPPRNCLPTTDSSFARYITATYIVPRLRFPIRGAKISQPHARSGGLFSSSAVPAVCVILFRDNPLGMVVDENWVVTIENGHVRQLPTINVAACYSTFHELLRR